MTFNAAFTIALLSTMSAMLIAGEVLIRRDYASRKLRKLFGVE